LLRLAVIQTGAGSYNRVHTMARVSGYGIEILEYLRDAAAGPFDRAEEQS